MNFKAVSLTDKGNFRKNNQDFIAYKENKFGQILAVVCDGMGGHAYGEVASKMAGEHLVELFSNQDFSKLNKHKVDKWFRMSIFAIKNKMEDYAFTHLEAMDMGTTLTALLVSEQGAFVLNVGDSRTYKLVGNQIQQISIDQNLLNENFSKQENSKIRQKAEMMGMNLNEITYWKVLVSALGPTKTLKIDTFYLDKSQGTYLLTTDGAHDYLEDEKIVEVLTNKQKLKNQAKELIELAKMNLSKDNLSMIIVEVE